MRLSKSNVRRQHRFQLWILLLLVISLVTAFSSHQFNKASAINNWTGWNQLSPGPNSTASAPSVVSWGPGVWDMVIRGGDNSILWRHYDENTGLGGWQAITGPNATDAKPVIASWGPNRLDVFWKGMNNILYHKAYSNGTWYSYDSMGQQITSYSAPAAVSWGNNRIDVFWRGVNNDVGQMAWNGSSWNGPYDVGGGPGITYNPPSVSSWDPGRLDLFVTGTDNGLYHKYFQNGSWSGGWEQLASPGTVANSGPAAVSRAHNYIDIFVRGTDNAIYHKAWVGSYWTNWDNNEGSGPNSTINGPAIASWSSRRLDLFVTGTDNAVYWMAYNQPADPSVGPSLAINQSLNAGSAIVSPSGNYEAIMQPDGNLVVYSLWDGVPRWSSGTNGSGANVLNFQSDGNLVVRPSGGAAVWASGTNTYGGYTLNMQDDGNLVQYGPNGWADWSSWYGKNPPTSSVKIFNPGSTTLLTNPLLDIKAVNVTGCTLNGSPVTTNGLIHLPKISIDTTYTVYCNGANGIVSATTKTVVYTKKRHVQKHYNVDNLLQTGGTIFPDPKINLSFPEFNSNGNWAGYSIDSGPGAFNKVEASMVVPNVTCPSTKNIAQVNFWVGIDGDGVSKTVEQDGIEADCAWTTTAQSCPPNGDVCNFVIAPTYYLWTEMYPNPPKTELYQADPYTQKEMDVNPGDVIHMSVAYDAAANQYAFNLTDDTLGITSIPDEESCPVGSVCSRSSAEWISENFLNPSKEDPTELEAIFPDTTLYNSLVQVAGDPVELPFSDYPNNPFGTNAKNPSFKGPVERVSNPTYMTNGSMTFKFQAWNQAVPATSY